MRAAAVDPVMERVLSADLELPSALLPVVEAPRPPRPVAAPRPGSRPGPWLLALALLGMLLAAGAWVRAWLLAPEHMALMGVKVHIGGEVHHTSREELGRALAEHASQSLFGLDLAAVRRDLEALPWVVEAGVQRVWPPRLIIQLREREALARWGEQSLLGIDGVVFTPEPTSIPEGLVRLAGPDGTAREVLERYHWIRERLATRGLALTRLELTDRRAWSLELTGGTRLALGTRDLEVRLQRFLDYLPRLPQPEAIEQVDLRYANGFAVRWRAQAMAQDRKVEG